MRWPVDSPTITPHGEYGFHRTTKPFCGGHPPCDHHGIDLAGKPGDTVYAPESGQLVYVFAGDKVKPFTRFGPAGVVLRGATSGKYHLLMHLEPSSLAFTPQQTTDTKGVQHATKLPGTIAVIEGTPIGAIGDRKHVHWEVRTDPADNQTHVDPETLDPEVPASSTASKHPPASARTTPEPRRRGARPAQGSGSGAGVLLILLLLALNQRK